MTIFHSLLVIFHCFKGVAVGPEFCRPESPSLNDENIWRVTIGNAMKCE